MTVLELVNNLAMLIVGGIMLMAFAIVIVRAVGEEQRKNSDHAVVSLDKVFEKAGKAAVAVIKGINAAMKEEEQKNEFEKYKRMMKKETSM